MPQTAKRATRTAPHAAQGVRTFAPGQTGRAGAEEPLPLASAGHGLERCPGCAYTPWPQCAACGAPTVYALEVAGVNGASGAQGHALTLCAACHALLLRLRDPRAEPLRYLPLTRQTKRQKQPAKQPARRSSRAQGGAA